MAMRLRYQDGKWICLCAAENEAEPGDVYLDDAQDHAIRQKLEADWRYEGFVPLASAEKSSYGLEIIY